MKYNNRNKNRTNNESIKYWGREREKYDSTHEEEGERKERNPPAITFLSTKEDH